MNTTAPKPRLLEKYKSEILAQLREELDCKNIMQVPKLEKVVVNIGIKEALEDVKILEQASEELSRITGQKPMVRKAKKSISAFKLREGASVGLKVTLRGRRMYEFLDRLFNIAMPRIRDFRGFSPSGFDGRGNYTLGLQEQTIFPEVDFDKIRKVKGMDITFVTSSKTDHGAKRLLELLGLPLRKN